MTQNKEGQQQPWHWRDAHWRDAHWRGLVERVRAGRKLRQTAWKAAARCAVALPFDPDHETMRDGAGSLSRLCWGQYGVNGSSCSRGHRQVSIGRLATADRER
jgi:hypothetical protein